jgi:ribosomal protein S8
MVCLSIEVNTMGKKRDKVIYFRVTSFYKDLPKMLNGLKRGYIITIHYHDMEGVKREIEISLKGAYIGTLKEFSNFIKNVIRTNHMLFFPNIKNRGRLYKITTSSSIYDN